MVKEAWVVIFILLGLLSEVAAFVVYSTLEAGPFTQTLIVCLTALTFLLFYVALVFHDEAVFLIIKLWNTNELQQALSLLGVKPDHPMQFRKELLNAINRYAGAMHNEPVAFQSKAMLLLLEKE